MWSVAAGIDRRRTSTGPGKTLLLQQFHDILPGSSIHWVYDVTRSELAEVLDTATTVIDEALDGLADGESGSGTGGSAGLVAFNPSSSDRTEVTGLPDGSVALVSAPGVRLGRRAPGPARRRRPGGDRRPVDGQRAVAGDLG